MQHLLNGDAYQKVPLTLIQVWKDVTVIRGWCLFDAQRLLEKMRKMH